MIFIEAVLMGSFATFYMDIIAKLLATKKVIYPFISVESMGRWFLYTLQGKLFHEDIDRSPKLKNEKIWCTISHYLIGVFLAGAFLTMVHFSQFVSDNVWTAFAFGLGTIFFPWFWLLPSIGKGIMASKSDNQMQILKTNFINHTNYGIGLMLWMILVHSFLISE